MHASQSGFFIAGLSVLCRAFTISGGGVRIMSCNENMPHCMCTKKSVISMIRLLLAFPTLINTNFSSKRKAELIRRKYAHWEFFLSLKRYVINAENWSQTIEKRLIGEWNGQNEITGYGFGDSFADIHFAVRLPLAISKSEMYTAIDLMRWSLSVFELFEIYDSEMLKVPINFSSYIYWHSICANDVFINWTITWCAVVPTSAHYVVNSQVSHSISHSANFRNTKCFASCSTAVFMIAETSHYRFSNHSITLQNPLLEPESSLFNSSGLKCVLPVLLCPIESRQNEMLSLFKGV